MKYAREKRFVILLCIDSNCHSSSFGTDDNKRGEVLDDYIAAHNLKIENKGIQIAVSVNDWTVVKGENFTDHNLSLIHI